MKYRRACTEAFSKHDRERQLLDIDGNELGSKTIEDKAIKGKRKGKRLVFRKVQKARTSVLEVKKEGSTNPHTNDMPIRENEVEEKKVDSLTSIDQDIMEKEVEMMRQKLGQD